jgi:predicted nucleic acid-binding protein
MVLDTNVVSELMKPSPDRNVLQWFLLNEEECFLSAVVIVELAYGIAKLENGAKRNRFEAQLSEWRIRFADRMLCYTDTSAMVYGEVMATRRSVGRPLSIPDGQLAATAIENACAVATRNTRDFEALALQVINPWDT